MTPKKADFVAMLQAKQPSEPAAALLGIKLLELTPGYAKLSVKLGPQFHNLAGITFGGIIMSLADEAFGYSVNSIMYPTVAVQFNIQFIASPATDDELFAEGKVVKMGRRAAFAEMTVTDQAGKLIAQASGTGVPLEPKKAPEKTSSD